MIPNETEMAQALGLVKRRENIKVQRGSPYIEITMSVRTRDMLGPPRKFVHKVYTISTLEADIEAAKEARRQGFEPWFVLDRKAVS